MIHIIPQHIGKGSYVAWYDLIEFEEPHIFHKFDDTEVIEKKIIGEPPYLNKLVEKLNTINPQVGDVVVLDLDYIFNHNLEDFNQSISELSKKYNECKFILFEDDNTLSYIDTEKYTVFSNRFSKNEYELNCNYYRFRSPSQDYWKSLQFVVNTFKGNIRQKKMNMIVGVDKIARLQTIKYVYNIGLDSDSWLGYSAFETNYDDSQISDSLLQFKKEKLPIILDTPYELSLVGNVNVEIPPLPITMTSYISCILETSLIVGNEIHLSEKAWNPFISQNIPLILGSSYINEYLQDIGFWMADDLFDLTPQLTTNDILQQYRNNLDIINNISYEDLHKYYIKNLTKIDSNFRLLEQQKFRFNSNNYK